ncbi:MULTISPECIES: ethanolamine ammonia-lyase subunit EutC [Methylomonas]|uniref:Ethanolamine ammonia-lyase small subunit n=2 Tax=Methylomonas TaxID=416 RepID=A0A140E4P1_9GAMM|nr:MULTISPECIES: ethanolamine ammonia-lyase subunit EutC [Methylomonas]AMK75365.1 ethanolamine ammonia-lyase [Methylomonas denitrificans]OAH97481.1 ethanolamine ammonia-lyase [Methylomonas methanica]TCV73128.1 ethanolamine ammonia-lyase light chain [Methylomonas methanica]
MNDPWITLRKFTQARIAQGRAGCSLPTKALLDFQLAHASARDAVQQIWDVTAFAGEVEKLELESLILATPVSSRIQYLQRPDLGRCLAQSSRELLAARVNQASDVALIVSNGLSSTAVDDHGLALLQAVVAGYAERGLRIGPICLVANARVALADDIGGLLNARLAVIIVGERPGLSAADSLGMYLTYAPTPGNTDAERNCISNIRPPDGLTYQAAATKLAYLSDRALLSGLSGVMLKDDMPDCWLTGPSDPDVATLNRTHFLK